MIINEKTEMGMGRFADVIQHCGHPAAANWDEEWRGRRWEDMPGPTEEFKKLNFALFRRGLLVEGNKQFVSRKIGT